MSTQLQDERSSAPITALIVLAAGAGTRMQSDLAKPLHTLAGMTMVEHVLLAGGVIDPDLTVLVANEQTKNIPAEIDRPDIRVVVQDPPLGTGHALRLALDSFPDIDRCVMLFADHPLLDRAIVTELFAAQAQPGVRVAILTMPAQAGSQYGRIEREGEHVSRIVEFADDLDRTAEYEANSGMMALDATWARERLHHLKPSRKGEFYLTDLVEVAVSEGKTGPNWPVITAQSAEDLLRGINDRAELAHAESILLDRFQREALDAGVTLRHRNTITIEADVEIGRDSVIEPGTVIRRGSRIGQRCVIGPNTIIERSSIGDAVRIVASVVEGSVIGDGSDVGPFAHLRAGADIAPGVHIGNYVEIKQSRLESGVRVGHVSYLGDATIGPNTNIGAGTITANFDGTGKHRTTIGANVLIGSDTMLVAPVEIGDGARTGAGSVVTRDVEPGQLVMGVPARARLDKDEESPHEGDAEG